jgi:hypothetical protein
MQPIRQFSPSPRECRSTVLRTPEWVGTLCAAGRSGVCSGFWPGLAVESILFLVCLQSAPWTAGARALDSGVPTGATAHVEWGAHGAD